MRAFKKVWAEFANPKTGLLERAQLVPFFGVSFVQVFFNLARGLVLLLTLAVVLEIGWHLRSAHLPGRIQRSEHFGFM
jgi:hypothetical protein